MIGQGQTILQFSWVVPDLAIAARRWHDAMGIGPFLVNRHLQIADMRYRGAPSQVDFSTAIAQAGDVQIELVEQHDDGPSCYRDTVPAGTEGMHHVAVVVEDYETEFSRYRDGGFVAAAEGRFGDVRYAYMDTSATIGHMVEILEDKPAIRGFFRAIASAAEKWDGNPETLMREL